METQKIRVILADDHPFARAGIELELDGVPNIRVEGSAHNSTELVGLLSSHPCDVLVTDYAMPGGAHGDGLELLEYLQQQHVSLRIVVVTALDKPSLIRSMLSVGITRIVSKADAVAHIALAVQAAFVGRSYYSPKIATITKAVGGGDPLSRLSQREAQVLALYVKGENINAIAVRLGRSKQTVSRQRIMAMAKLGIDNDAELFAFAAETGMFDKVPLDELEPRE